MNVLVIGAAGKTGTSVVEQALAASQQITAFVRRAADYQRTDVRVVEGEAAERVAMEAAVLGQDAVLDTIGGKTPWKTTTLEEFAQTVFAPAFKSLFFWVLASMFLISSCKKKEVQRNCLALESSYTTTNEILAPAPMLQQRITGTGNSTHLGSIEHVALVTADLTTPPPFKLAGTGTFSAADGDEFYTAFTGTISPNSDGTSTVVINHDINGGTGRFIGATGKLIANSISDPTKSTGLTTSEGQLCY